MRFWPYACLCTLAFAVPVTAVAQSGPSETSPPSAETVALVNCAAANNAGSVRWLFALLDRHITPASVNMDGAVRNAMTAAFSTCSMRGAKLIQVLEILKMMVPHMNGSPERDGKEGEYTDCLITRYPERSSRYLVEADNAVVDMDSDERADRFVAFISSTPDCKGAKPGIEGMQSVERLYSKLNWALRAKPALAALQASEKGGQQ